MQAPRIAHRAVLADQKSRTYSPIIKAAVHKPDDFQYHRSEDCPKENGDLMLLTPCEGFIECLPLRQFSIVFPCSPGNRPVWPRKNSLQRSRNREFIRENYRELLSSFCAQICVKSGLASSRPSLADISRNLASRTRAKHGSSNISSVKRVTSLVGSTRSRRAFSKRPNWFASFKASRVALPSALARPSLTDCQQSASSAGTVIFLPRNLMVTGSVKAASRFPNLAFFLDPSDGRSGCRIGLA